MRGHDAAIGVNEGVLAPRHLPLRRPAGKLAVSLGSVRHAARDAAMAEGEKPAMGVQRQRAGGRKVPSPRALGRTAARREADFLQQDRQRDGEGVVDGEVIDIGEGELRFIERAARRVARAVIRRVGNRAQVLVPVPLAGAEHGDARLHARLGRYDERHGAVRDRAAIEHLERRADGFRGQHVLAPDRILQVGLRMPRGMGAHEDREFREIRLREARLVQVTGGEQRIVGGHGRPIRNFEVRVPHLGERLDGSVARLAAQPVLAGHDEHVRAASGAHQLPGEHEHCAAGRPAELDAVRVSGLEREALAEERRQHEMGQRRGIAAQHAVDVAALEPRVGEGTLRGIGHQVERPLTLQTPEAGVAGSSDIRGAH